MARNAHYRFTRYKSINFRLYLKIQINIMHVQSQGVGNIKKTNNAVVN